MRDPENLSIAGRLRAEIRKGLDDIEAGRTVDGDAAFDALRNALSLKDDPRGD
ncbi:MAG: hypothetical protein HWD60_00320 [Defluviicoccus sp.]|nr:MAG: hypothetical protein HWD60_00320 [Defluviicoccus sp.]